MNNITDKKEVISIIIPFYCTRKELYKRCLDSVLDNELVNIEVLVIDDGSPDNYLSVLNYRSSDDRLKIIRNKHSGPSGSRNLGIDTAKGNWIMFLDSDDFLNSEVFYKIADNISSYSNDVEIFWGGKYQNGKFFPNDSFLSEDHNYASTSQDKNYIMQSALSIGNYPEEHIQYFSLGAPYCKLISKSFLSTNDLKFDETIRFAEDVEFMLKIYLNARSVYYHEMYLYNYVMYSESATKKFRPDLSKDMDLFFEKIKSFLEKNNLYKDLEKAFYVRVEYEAGHCYRSEFFHYKNKDQHSDAKFNEFCKKEPYASALKFKYLPKNRIKLKILFFLIYHNLGFVYKYLSFIYLNFLT